MPSWNELLSELDALPPAQAGPRLDALLDQTIESIGHHRGGRNVVLYASAFLQKPQAPAQNVIVTGEDINGLMSVLYGMDCTKGLTLVIHTPGGVMNAAETLVAYLRSKFDSIEAIVPMYAMSAGTMISLGTDRVVMGRQSQLGPIDAQLQLGGRSASARAIVEQFERAKLDIVGDAAKPGNTLNAHVWAPILASMGPALLQEAQNTLDYGETMVAGWLGKWMLPLAGVTDPVARGKTIARHFNDASTHKSHGRRIDRDEARQQGVVVEDLEDSQDLQEAVLTLYHLMTIMFEKTIATKAIRTTNGRGWLKNWAQQQQVQLVQGGPLPAGLLPAGFPFPQPE